MVATDWIKSSSLRLNNRGLIWCKEFGLEEGVKSLSVEYDRLSVNVMDAQVLLNAPEHIAYLLPCM